MGLYQKNNLTLLSRSPESQYQRFSRARGLASRFKMLPVWLFGLEVHGFSAIERLR